MGKHTKLFILLAISLILLAVVAIYWFIPNWLSVPDTSSDLGYNIGFNDDTVKARVLDILEDGTTELGGQTQSYQILLVKVQDGPFSGQLLEIDYGLRQIRPPGLSFQPGDDLLVTVGQLPDGTVTGYFTDYVRTQPLLWLFGIFVIFSVLISGWKGIRSLISLAISLMVIIYFMIPQILAGKDPVLISIIGAFILMTVTLYVTYGWNLKSHAAVAGTLISLIVTGLLANFFVVFTRLTGFGSEDALFLIQQSQASINLRGLVLGGILIGALGVLDDLVISQASAVFELFQANPNQGIRKLFNTAMRIGQDHVAATVNTLVLAYAGAALPTLLLFSLSGEQYSYLINFEFVTEEIVRTLVGSLGLIAAVPITTFLSSLLAVRHSRLSGYLP
jgi:uncharacterized membrane protein